VTAGGGGREEVLAGEVRLAGEVLAAAVHEVNNRIATLEQGLGLVGDLLEGAKGGRGAEAVAAAARLTPELARLAELNRRLGLLADGLRAGAPGVEPSAAVAALLELTERVGRRREVRVASELAAGLPALAVDRAGLWLLVHTAVTAALERCAGKATLRVATLRKGNEVGIRLAVSGGAGSGPIGDEVCPRLAVALGGRWEEAGGGEATAWFAAPR
jgi:C4-dicarboxylate-specific signal transduction histidine kinase